MSKSWHGGADSVMSSVALTSTTRLECRKMLTSDMLKPILRAAVSSEGLATEYTVSFLRCFSNRLVAIRVDIAISVNHSFSDLSTGRGRSLACMIVAVRRSYACCRSMC